MSKEEAKDEETAFTTSGIWMLISHINHICMSNCRRSLIGDMQIVRATKDLEAGTELVLWYQKPRQFQSYDEVHPEGPWQLGPHLWMCAVSGEKVHAHNEVVDAQKPLGESSEGYGKRTSDNELHQGS